MESESGRAAPANAPIEILERLVDTQWEALTKAYATAGGEEARRLGLKLLQLVASRAFHKGPRHWFQHDLEFYYLCERAGIHFLPVHFYSVLPNTTAIPEAHWTNYRTPGVEWCADAQWRFLEHELVPRVREFEQV